MMMMKDAIKERWVGMGLVAMNVISVNKGAWLFWVRDEETTTVFVGMGYKESKRSRG